MLNINCHFRRESKIMLLGAISLILFGLLIGIVAPRVVVFIGVDKCLDSGGSYNHQHKMCVGATTNTK
jgi:hypothetical protein